MSPYIYALFLALSHTPTVFHTQLHTRTVSHTHTVKYVAGRRDLHKSLTLATPGLSAWMLVAWIPEKPPAFSAVRAFALPLCWTAWRLALVRWRRAARGRGTPCLHFLKSSSGSTLERTSSVRVKGWTVWWLAQWLLSVSALTEVRCHPGRVDCRRRKRAH